jgi:hypothetical protein
MVRFLLIVAVLCVLLSIGAGLFNRAKLLNKMAGLANTRQEVQKLQKQVGDLIDKNKQTEERLNTEERIAQGDRTNSKAALDSTTTKLNQVTDQLATRDNDNKALMAALAEAGRNLDSKKSAESDRDALGGRLTKVENELNRIRREWRGKPKAGIELEGTIISVNREAQAVTTTLGSALGVTPNAHLSLVKDGEKVAQLRVVSVDNESCVAQLIQGGPQDFAKIAVGETVTKMIR